MVNVYQCSDLTLALATIGAIVIYFLIGLLIGYIVYELSRNARENDRRTLVVLSVVFWPIAICVFVIYIIIFWITAPLWAASKEDLKDTERRLSHKIDERCSDSIVDIDDDDYIAAAPAPSFKEGDIITGIIPQTNVRGENISYDHLYQGCKCRVLRIDDNDSMKVILIDHKDKEAHRSAIGRTFTAPARNFKLVKKNVKRSKAVKKKRAKR